LLFRAASGDDDLPGRAVLAFVVGGAGGLPSWRLLRGLCGGLRGGLGRSRSRKEGRCGNCAKQSGACGISAHVVSLPLAGDNTVPAIRNMS
jgi:hypothetical protein